MTKRVFMMGDSIALNIGRYWQENLTADEFELVWSTCKAGTPLVDHYNQFLGLCAAVDSGVIAPPDLVYTPGGTVDALAYVHGPPMSDNYNPGAAVCYLLAIKQKAGNRGWPFVHRIGPGCNVTNCPEENNTFWTGYYRDAEVAIQEIVDLAVSAGLDSEAMFFDDSDASLWAGGSGNPGADGLHPSQPKGAGVLYDWCAGRWREILGL